MVQGLLQIKKLTLDDYEAFKKMDTGIDDDYVTRIFPDLVKHKHQGVYGLFHQGQMVSIAGYSIFGEHFAVLGRLRSDRRFLSKGYATRLVEHILGELEQMPQMKWVGANTQVPNWSARRVLEKLGLEETVTFYSAVLKERDQLQGLDGNLWIPVESTEEKRKLFSTLSSRENQLGMFPYECYYPLPFHEALFSDEYLAESIVFRKEDGSRFFVMKEDQKGNVYAHLKYFWDDSFEQPGFWKTVLYALDEIFTNHKLWIDFSEGGFHRMPSPGAFYVQDPWILYSKEVPDL
ncbi:FR47-like protein [Melghiribacillus thermohalophilus]|uniref:FR47-like protein n=1 Tax=Melghiribacillus thermohalophilus TaxID=1324956 RepID=A0A4R3MR47_9BACI|nr:GNAT family N-acetyltransferase [Melghiribacillus thermohalophilus]TCT18800.1 FR47-like protein [Melghiribacillus thermohalophilus]